MPKITKRERSRDYYPTKDNAAKTCGDIFKRYASCNDINLRDYTMVSIAAGDGRMTRNEFPDALMFDIKPLAPDVKECSFENLPIEQISQTAQKDIIIYDNPPFKHISKIFAKFSKHYCIKIVAFIMPVHTVFGEHKGEYFASDFELSYMKELAIDSFGYEISAQCSLQVWVRKGYISELRPTVSMFDNCKLSVELAKNEESEDIIGYTPIRQGKKYMPFYLNKPVTTTFTCRSLAIKCYGNQDLAKQHIAHMCKKMHNKYRTLKGEYGRPSTYMYYLNRRLYQIEISAAKSINGYNKCSVVKNRRLHRSNPY